MNRPRPLSGFPELTPEARIVEQHVLDRLRQHLRAARLQLRSRPARSSRWTGWPSRARSTKRCTRSSGCRPNRGRAAELGLHFDLTVPFARYVLENAHQLAFPFRRYQIQKVWRGERPQEGRYREFTQADMDIIDANTLAAHHDVELPLVALEALERLHVDLGVPPVLMRVSNRKLAQGFYLGLDIADPPAVLRQVDKIDKIGPDRVRALLGGRGRDRATAPGGRLRPAGDDQLGRRIVRRRRSGPSAYSHDRAGPGTGAAGRRGAHRGPLRARPADRRPQGGPGPGLLHRHGLRDRTGRVRVLGVDLLRRPLRRAGQPTAAPPTRASVCRSASPGCWPRCSPAAC